MTFVSIPVSLQRNFSEPHSERGFDCISVHFWHIKRMARGMAEILHRRYSLCILEL